MGGVTLEEVRADAGRFPAEVLEGQEAALVLFAAAFQGRQDAVWVADAGMTATCVDTDGERLEEMRGLYPHGWEFVNADVFEFIDTNRRWDVVTVDCPTSLFKRMAGMTERLCELANRAVVLGTGPDTPIAPPDGWTVTDRLRRSSSGASWAVLERE